MPVKTLINPKVKANLDAAIHAELFAHNLYLHLANQLQRLGYFGAQKFFLGESSSEREHCLRIVGYLNDVGDCAKVPAIEAMSDKVSSLEDAIELAYRTEVTLYRDYVAWHAEDCLELHAHDAEARGIADGDWVGITSRAGETVLRAKISDRMQPGVVYTTFHHPFSGANVITTENSDWATNCPEYKITAVEVARVSQPSEWQQRYRAFSEVQQALLRERRREAEPTR